MGYTITMETTELRTMGFNPFRRSSSKTISSNATTTSAASAKVASTASRLRRLSRSLSQLKSPSQSLDEAGAVLSRCPSSCSCRNTSIRSQTPTPNGSHSIYQDMGATMLRPSARFPFHGLITALILIAIPGATEMLATRLIILHSAWVLIAACPWRW